MNIFRTLFGHRHKGGQVPDIGCGDATPQYSKEESAIIDLLHEILKKIDNISNTKENNVSAKSSSTSSERPEIVSHPYSAEIQDSKQLESYERSSFTSLQMKAIEALCNKILSWEEQKEMISSMTSIDVVNFVIKDSKQILHTLNIPTISEDKKFNISRHEPIDLNGKIPRPGSEIESIVEDGFELNGKILIRAKVTLK